MSYMAPPDALTIESCQAMLQLFTDIFYEYIPKDDSITLYNTGDSLLKEGTVELSEFIKNLRCADCPEVLSELGQFTENLRKCSGNFSVLIHHDLLFDSSDSLTLIRGKKVTCSNGRDTMIGLIRLQRTSDINYKGNLNYDPLTGTVTKDDITKLAVDYINNLHAGNTTIAIIDIDYFKHVNDTYGHMYGDHVLQTIAGIAKNEVGKSGIIGRIGGDEFLIIFYNTSEKDHLRDYLTGIRKKVIDAFPGKGPQYDKPISVSIGTATYPDHADNYNDLFTLADYSLYLAKEKGRNRYIMYTPEKHAPLEHVREHLKNGNVGNIVNGHDDLPLGDVLIQMQFMIRDGQHPELSSLLSEFARRSRIPLLLIYRDEPRELIFSTGPQADTPDAQICEIIRYLSPEDYSSRRNRSGLILCNNTNYLSEEISEIKERLLALEVLSFILIPYTDAEGNKVVLAFLSLQKNLVWNQDHFMHYSLFTDMISTYPVTDLLN